MCRRRCRDDRVVVLDVRMLALCTAASDCLFDCSTVLAITRTFVSRAPRLLPPLRRVLRLRLTRENVRKLDHL